MKKFKNILFALVALFLCAGVVYAADYATLPDSDGEVAYREIEAIKRKFDGWSTYTTDILGIDDKYIAVGYDCPIREPGKKSDVKGNVSPEVKINFDKREDKPKNGMVYLDNPKIFYGRNINTNQ